MPKTMKISIDVSTETEGARSTYWMILDPSQNMSCDIDVLGGMLTGPFFDRESAENFLEKTRYNFSKRAHVYSLSGCHSGQYDEKYMEEYYRLEKETKCKQCEIWGKCHQYLQWETCGKFETGLVSKRVADHE